MNSGAPDSHFDYNVAYLAAIVESSDDAIVGKSLQSIVTSWNPAAERIFGFSAEDMIGQSILRIVPPDRQGEEADIISRIARGERVDHFETIRVTKSGRLIEVSVTVSPIKDGTGTVVGASKILRDITERRHAELERDRMLAKERELREHAERADRIKNEFLATLSHELRTPLTAILGWAQILRSESLPADNVRRAGDVIYRNAQMQAQLVEELLDMNRILMGKVRIDVQPLELSAVIEAAIESVQPSVEAKGIRMVKLLDPLAGPVRGDPTRLQQVVWNLLSNAVKFTPKGGRVEVALERVNSHVEISVSDTGIGIQPEFLAHVFDRFSQADASTTRRYSGLGLGLAIVKHLVELHGGTVHAKSAGEGLGATFRVALPLSPARHSTEADRVHPGAPCSAPIDWTPPDLSGKAVLLVEDDPDSAEIVSRILGRSGAKVTIAFSANEALAMGLISQFDLLISDIGMPGMDGFELIKSIRALDKAAGGKIPAVALTAFSRTEDRRSAMMLGYDVFLSKPVDPWELVAVVARCVFREK
jgi:PAS domain S-box-containing protein